MNVLFLIHRYPPAVGGSERFAQEMARRLARGGHDVAVYTSDVLEMEGFWRRGQPRLAGGLEHDAGVEVHRFRARVLPGHGAVSRVLGLAPWAPVGLTFAPPGFVLPGLWRAVRSRGDWDLVYASAYPSLMYLGLVAARRSGARLVLMPCTHGSGDLAIPFEQAGSGDLAIPFEQVDGWRRWSLSRRVIELYRHADAIVALTERERQLLTQSGIQAERIHVTGAGVDPGEALAADGHRFRARLGLAADRPILAFVGHKTLGKGALDLLEACRWLIPERPELLVAVVGAPTPAFERRLRAMPEEVRERVLDLRLSEQEKHDLLAASSALVLPSRDDSFGIVLLEAWLHGKPVIGARAGGIPEVISDGETGLLVPYGDVAALRSAITWVLDHPAAAAQMGARGREKTLDLWTWEAVYRRMKQVYEPCVDEPGEAR